MTDDEAENRRNAVILCFLFVTLWFLTGLIVFNILEFLGYDSKILQTFCIAIAGVFWIGLAVMFIKLLRR